MKKYKNYIFGAAILILGIAIGNISSGDGKSEIHNNDEHDLVQDTIKKIWTCSMHPQIQMDKPGNCTICRTEERREGKKCRTRWAPYH